MPKHWIGLKWSDLSHALSSHSDVSTTAATDGQVLKWSDSDSKWAHTHADTAGLSSVDWTQVNNKPATFTPSSHTHSWGDISGGDFNSLTNFDTTTQFDISDYLAVSDSGGNNVRKITVEDLIQLHNAEKTKEQLDASDTDEQTLLDPTEVIEVDPDEGGGVQVEFDAVEGRCVLANDPPLTLSNFKQLIDPFGGLKLNPTYGTPDANNCRSYSYTISVDDSGSAATEYTLLLGKHDDIDIKGSSTPVSVRGHAFVRKRSF